jgi:hypothetical protein
MTDPTARFKPVTRRWIAVLSLALVALCAFSAYDAWVARNWLKVGIGVGGAAFFLYCAVEWWRRAGRQLIEDR